MKVLAVRNLQYPNGNRMVSNPIPNKRSEKMLELDSTKYAELDYYPYSMSNIQFTSKFFDRYSKQWLRGLLKLGLPCPCCGKLMPELNEIKSLPSLGVFSGSCVATLAALKPYENIMKPVEKNIYEILQPLADKYPGIDLQELMILLSFEYERQLVAPQLTILNDMKALAPNLEREEDQQELLQTIATAKDFILRRKPVKFKRKTFIKDVDEFLPKIDDKHLRNKLAKLAYSMPTSEDSISAFIMKYKDRSPEEIGERLLIFAAATLEHITLDSEGGEVLIWECQQCNNKRGDKSVIYQIKHNPDMLDHLKTHLQVIIDRANHLKRHGGKIQAQKMYDYTAEVRNEYLINIQREHETIEKIETEALEKLEFEEVPIPKEYNKKN